MRNNGHCGWVEAAAPCRRMIGKPFKTLLCLATFISAPLSPGRAVDTPAAAAPEPVFSAAQIEFFEKKIRPVLAESCYDCHTGGSKAKSGLQLDHREGWLKGSDYRPVVDLKEPAKSILIRAVSHSGEKGIPAMPEKGDKLSAAAIADLTEWIAMGLPWPKEAKPSGDQDPRQHWSFQPVTPAPIPADAGHPIDHFVKQAQSAAGVTPAPRADRATLHRRLHFALLGLPPKFEDLKAFVEDPRPDDEAYEALVDSLLPSPH